MKLSLFALAATVSALPVYNEYEDRHIEPIARSADVESRRGLEIDLGGSSGLKRDAEADPGLEIDLGGSSGLKRAAGLEIDLGGSSGLKRDAEADPGLEIDLGASSGLKRDAEADPGLEIDLGGSSGLKRDAEADPGLEIDLGGSSGLKSRDNRPHPVTGTVNQILSQTCNEIGGTMLTRTVCRTVSGSDIKVSALDPKTGTAKVTISGRGLLQGASITVPVGSLSSILKKLA